MHCCPDTRDFLRSKSLRRALPLTTVAESKIFCKEPLRMCDTRFPAAPLSLSTEGEVIGRRVYYVGVSCLNFVFLSLSDVLNITQQRLLNSRKLLIHFFANLFLSNRQYLKYICGDGTTEEIA